MRLGRIIFLLMLAVPVLAFAAPPASPYLPGETLEPSCDPGDTNCTVVAPLTATGTPETGTLSFWDSATTLSDTVGLLWDEAGSRLGFEGATDNAFEVFIVAGDPTADRTITFPDASVVVNAAGDLSGATLASNVVTSSLTSLGALSSLVISGAVDANGQADIGDGGDTVSIDSSDWDITTAGVITGVSLDANGTGNSVSNIESADIADGTLDADDFDFATEDGAPADGECLKFETSGGGDFLFGPCSAGITAWDAIGDPSGAGSVAMATFAQTLDWDVDDTTAAALDGLSLTIDNDGATDVSTQRLFVLTNADDGGASGSTESLLVLDNADTDELVGSAIQITDAGGGFTAVIDNAGTLISSGELNLLDGGVTYSELTNSGTLTVTTVDINGGAIDGTAIGASSASTGAFTTLSASGTLSANGTLDANGQVDLGDGGDAFSVDSLEFDVAAATGAITINDGGDAGALVIEGTNLDINDLTFAASGTVSTISGNLSLLASGTGTTANVQLGAGGAGSTTPDLLVLDIKSSSGDPTGTNGAMYYNANLNAFRCFQNSAWTNCITPSGSDVQQSASYDVDDLFTNIPTGGAQTVLGTVSVTPTAATGDVYVSGWASVYSSNGTDQPFNLVIETTSDCTGAVVGNASVTYTITSAGSITVDRGALRISGIAVDPGASSQAYSLCAAVTSGGGDTDVITWGIEATVIDTGADLAEIYTSNDASLQPGDVVSADPSLRTGMKKSEGAYDRNVLGIISTRPGVLIGGVDDEGVIALPVALSGRVPVNVTTESGPIEPGDYLTSSSVPGLAMKAVEEGPVIGQALSSYDGEGVGSVLVFVENFYRGGSADASVVDPFIIDAVQLEAPHNPLAVIGQRIADARAFVADLVVARVTAVRGYFDEAFSRVSHQRVLCIGEAGNETCVTKDDLDALLSGQRIEPTDDSSSFESYGPPATFDDVSDESVTEDVEEAVTAEEAAEAVATEEADVDVSEDPVEGVPEVEALTDEAPPEEE